jgi:cysteinyl-tRNA synthetase
MSEVPENVRELASRRDEARREKDFAAADALRERIRELGFEVTDSPEGSVFARRAASEAHGARVVESAAVPSRLADPAIFDVSVHWIDEGWPDDIRRGMASFDRHRARRTIQHVVVDAREVAPEEWPIGVEVIHLRPDTGWAAARNAGLLRTAGETVVVADGSIEASGDAIGPLCEALADPSVGVTGPYGIVTADLREFKESPGPEVDAVEGYLLAFRRRQLQDGLRFDEKFRFYRTADIELSFQVKAAGLRATVTPVPVRRHEHRMWAHTPEDERARLSKRNYYRFLDRWRGRTDLLVEPHVHDHG